MGLDVLVRHLVPPAAAAVILSRVLSSWAASEAGNDADAVDVILSGLRSDRQKLQLMLTTGLPRMVEDRAPEFGVEWGSNFDYVVPELRAAFERSVAHMHSTRVRPDSATILLFRFAFQASGGFPDVRFPLSLLVELREHNSVCASMVVQRVLRELREAADEDGTGGWDAAEEVWPAVSWDTVDLPVLEEVVAMLKGWMSDVRVHLPRAKARVKKALVVRLMCKLPLHRLSDPEVELGYPFPAHVLAAHAQKHAQQALARIAVLEASNIALRAELDHLRSTSRSG